MATSVSPAKKNHWPTISQFYSHKDVFITGATGFLGKCLVEKLLRGIPDIGRVLILVRGKRGKTAKERVEAILASKVRFLRLALWTVLSLLAVQVTDLGGYGC